MVQVEMSDDIRKYQTKSIGPFTTRQAVWLFIGILIGALCAIPLPLSWDNKIIIGGFTACPIAFCGFKKMDGVNFEIFVIRYIYYKFLTPRKRKKKTRNSYKESLNQIRERKEKMKLRKMTPKQQKEYLKNKKNPKIEYSRKKAHKIYL